jgi:FHS family L-fucose permease-like MFS transporter
MALASAPTPQGTPPTGSDTRYTYHPLALGVITTIFFMWGFLTCLNDILIPHLKAVFELNYARAMLVQLTFFGAYFLMSLPAGKVIASLGYKKGIVTGLAIAALGAVGFWPAATLHSYIAFLAALFVLATGITVLQVAANPYVALLGPERTSSSRLTLAQALNSLGTTLAPLFGGLLILAAASTTLPKGIHDAPETKQLVTTVNNAAPDAGVAALTQAPAERATAAIGDISGATLDKLPTTGFVASLNRLTSAQLGETLAVLPTDKLLAVLKAQTPDRLNAMPADKLAPALDKLSSSKLADDQSAQLQAVRDGLPQQTKNNLQNYRNTQADVVKVPYIGLAVVLLVLAAGVWMFKLPSLTETTGGADQGRHTLREALSHPHVLFGVLGIFFYVGAEVSIGSFLVNYLSLPDIGHMSENQATHYVALYWGGAMVGRIIGSGLMVKVSPRKLLALFATIAGALVLTTMLTTSDVAVWSIVAIGLFNSIMFPTIFSLGIERLGPLTGKASSLLIMAIVGGALLPVLQGVVADNIGVQHAFFIPLLCYGYIVFYGLVGSKVRTAVATV